jgi:glycosyltransferase involved in cell wall biosynthesis
VPHSDIPLYLKSANVLILPNSAKQDISRLYTSPLKLFEYMASGVPIVASDIQSLREVLSENSTFFFEADNPESLAQKILYVVNHEAESCEKAAVAKNAVEEYTWESRSKKILDFIIKHEKSTNYNSNHKS